MAISKDECKSYVVETYQSDTSWYRVYSDGWCEQGGRYIGTLTNASTATITLLKPYKDTNYTISLSAVQINSKWGYVWVSYNSQHTTSFKIASGGNSTSDGTSSVMWLTQGYIN